jgi:hypothetical protein
MEVATTTEAKADRQRVHAIRRAILYAAGNKQSTAESQLLAGFPKHRRTRSGQWDEAALTALVDYVDEAKLAALVAVATSAVATAVAAKAVAAKAVAAKGAGASNSPPQLPP